MYVYIRVCVFCMFVYMITHACLHSITSGIYCEVMQNVPFKQLFLGGNLLISLATEVGGVRMEEVKKKHTRKALNKCGLGQPLPMGPVLYLDIYQSCFLPVAQ